MEQSVLFCDNTMEETAIKINNTESILKRQLEKKEYEEIKKNNYINLSSSKEDVTSTKV